MHPVKYMLSICFSWPPGCHSFKIRGTIGLKPISIEWHRRIEQVKYFLSVNRNHSILSFLSCCQIWVEICYFSTQCWPMQSHWIYRDKIQSILWHSSGVFNSLSIKIRFNFWVYLKCLTSQIAHVSAENLKGLFCQLVQWQQCWPSLKAWRE